ncbi:HET-domain-containing protein [Annulohypoxylon maeteangense]|uniref:HET-domain-containing protein n=1 Tax=Annulohypoxylon maeteangense TaxID=1927788 RepID=UPI0020077091|nr:HET-domain-containing protein [Annulohypoxylon maeteangense]KAI0888690.1 HET-domain-containing protein [Annulohypoxylon maeteangense]
MARCTICASLTVEEIRDRMTYYYPNLRSLRDSAAAGCDMCQLCWTSLQKINHRDIIAAVLAGKCPEDEGGGPLVDERVWLTGAFSDKHRAVAAAQRDKAEKASGSVGSSSGLAGPDSGSQVYVSCGNRDDPETTNSEAFLNSTLGVFADPGTPAARLFVERFVSPDRNPRGHVEFARGMVAVCKKRHRECGNATEDRNPEMPTRVIDVGTAPGETKLVNALNRGIREPYVALSYCWGQGVRHATELNDGNLGSLLEFIDETKLTAAHLECISIARDFGIRYVWIDSLCIIQGNEADWNYESKKMAIVYGNATLTVIAARSADSRQGFLANKQHSAAPPVALPFGTKDASGKDMGNIYLHIPRKPTTGPLHRRGWCFQEAVLSRRKLIFENAEIRFSCQRTEHWESGKTIESQKLRKQLFQGFRLTNPHISSTIDEKERERLRSEMLYIWYKMLLWDFTPRLLTNPSDIFAAISGIAQLAEMSIRSRYLAGIWEVDMVRGLLWHTWFSFGMKVKKDYGGQFSLLDPIEPVRPTDWDGKPVVRAPSWSWASIQGHVHERSTPRDEYILKDPANYLIRPKPRPKPHSTDKHDDESDILSWTALDNPNCGPDVLHMPYCELCFLGQPKQVRCSKWTTVAGFTPKWEAPPTRIRQMGEQGYMVLLEPAKSEYARLNELGLLPAQDTPSTISSSTEDEGSVISPALVFANAVFDVLEDRAGVTDCWFLPIIKEKWKGLLLRKDPSNGKFRRLGMVSVSKKEFLPWVVSGPEEEIHLV